MPKLKTHKATSKRFKVTKNKKVLKRTAGQDHFNAKESGNKTRKKRRDGQLSKSLTRTVKTAMVQR